MVKTRSVHVAWNLQKFLHLKWDKYILKRESKATECKKYKLQT